MREMGKGRGYFCVCHRAAGGVLAHARVVSSASKVHIMSAGHGVRATSTPIVRDLGRTIRGGRG